MSSFVDNTLCSIKVSTNELLTGCQTYIEAYNTFLQSNNIPQSLESDIFQQNDHEQQENEQEVNQFCCRLYLLYNATVSNQSYNLVFTYILKIPTLNFDIF